MRRALGVAAAALAGVALFSARAPAHDAPAAPPLATPPVPRLRLPTTVLPTRYDATLTVDPARDTFSGAISIDLTVPEPVRFVWMNGQDLAVSEASVVAAGRTIAAHAVTTSSDFLGFAFDREVPAGRARLDVRWTGHLPEDEGMGLFRQEDEGRWYAWTQFEELGARRVFPCFDEPSFKTPWKLSVVVPSGAVAVSNTPSTREQVDAKSGTKTVSFAETRPLPSYLVALAVGPFDVVSAGRAGRGHTPLRVLVQHGDRKHARVAARTLAQLVPALEEYFDVPFPWPKLDVVTIPSFNGAMENAGMITADDSLLLVRPGETELAREKTVFAYLAHETAHQWFGDMVTMDWWDDIWLNEAFAEWMEGRIAARVHPEWDADGEAIVERSRAMRADALVSARTIRQPVLSKDDIVDAFDEILYAKGASTLRMFEASVGEATFRKGVHRYLSAHAYGSATTADFVHALSEASGRDLQPEMASFLDQPGVPLLSAGLDCGPGHPPRVTLEQRRLLPVGTRGETAVTWHLPVCVRAGSGDRDESTACETISEPSATIALSASRCPDWILVGAGATGYFRVRYTGTLRDHLIARIDRLSAPERLMLTDDAVALFQAGRASAAETLPLVRAAAASGDPRRLALAVDFASDLGEASLVPRPLADHYARWVRSLLSGPAQTAGWTPHAGERAAESILRPDLLLAAGARGGDPALVAQAQARARAWLADPEAPETELAKTALEIAAWHGDAAFFDECERAAAAAKDVRRALLIHSAELVFPDEASFRRALAHTDDPGIPPLELLSLSFRAFTRPEHRATAWRWAADHFDSLRQRIPGEEGASLFRLPGWLCDSASRDEAAALLGPRAKKVVGGPLELQQGLEEADLCIARRAKQQDEVAEFLRAR